MRKSKDTFGNLHRSLLTSRLRSRNSTAIADPCPLSGPMLQQWAHTRVQACGGGPGAAGYGCRLAPVRGNLRLRAKGARCRCSRPSCPTALKANDSLGLCESLGLPPTTSSWEGSRQKRSRHVTWIPSQRTACVDLAHTVSFESGTCWQVRCGFQ